MSSSSSSTQHRFEVISLVIRNVLTTNSKTFQIHGDKQIVAQVLPTAPERAYITNDCYDSSLDLGSIPYTDILQRLLRLGFEIESSASGSYNSTKQEKSIIKDDPQQGSSQDTLVLQYTLIRKHVVG